MRADYSDSDEKCAKRVLYFVQYFCVVFCGATFSSTAHIGLKRNHICGLNRILDVRTSKLLKWILTQNIGFIVFLLVSIIWLFLRMPYIWFFIGYLYIKT